jgi:glyoxylase-like metal-dependent hydrolase (beta-lactamase superfamily II)
MDVTNKKTYLHVVYCGRGDALILEYWAVGPNDPPGGGRKLVLLDGGPLSAHAMTENGPKRGFLRPSAPYWMYYVATAQERWHAITPVANPPTKPRPFAIIASHLDADHYGGLMHLLRTSWPRDMDFDGPFAFPAKTKKNQ